MRVVTGGDPVYATESALPAREKRWTRANASDRGHPSTFDRRILRASRGVPAMRQVDRLEEAGQLDRVVEDPGQVPVRPGPRPRLRRATPMRAPQSPPDLACDLLHRLDTAIDGELVLLGEEPAPHETGRARGGGEL